MENKIEFIKTALEKVSRAIRFEGLHENSVVTISGTKTGFFGDEEIEIEIGQSKTDPILNALLTARINKKSMSAELTKEWLYNMLSKTDMIDEKLFIKLNTVLFLIESPIDRIFKKPLPTFNYMEPEREISSIRKSLISLKKSDELEPHYWQMQSDFCFRRIVYWFNKGKYDVTLELILDFLTLRPNYFEAYPYLARCYQVFNNTEKLEGIYQEILEWALGDWNEMAESIENEDNERAWQNINLHIQKLNFFIDYVDTFFYAYKMRAKCYGIMGEEEKEKNDIEKYNEKANQYGSDYIPSWALQYGLK